MIKIGICEDNAVNRNQLIALIKQVEEKGRAFDLYEYEAGEHLVSDAGVQHDVVFIDVELAGTLNGYATAELLRERNENVLIAFCTGTQGGLPAKYVSLGVKGYILKTDTDEEKLSALHHIFGELYRNPQKMMFKTTHGRMNIVDLNQVLYFAGFQRHVWIKMLDDNMTVSRLAFLSKEEQKELLWTNEKMSAVYDKVQPYWFEHATVGCIVNLQHVANVSSKSIRLINDEILSLSRANEPLIKRRIMRYARSINGTKEPQL